VKPEALEAEEEEGLSRPITASRRDRSGATGSRLKGQADAVAASHEDRQSSPRVGVESFALALDEGHATGIATSAPSRSARSRSSP
jgi:hypothetical protein